MKSKFATLCARVKNNDEQMEYVRVLHIHMIMSEAAQRIFDFQSISLAYVNNFIVQNFQFIFHEQQPSNYSDFYFNSIWIILLRLLDVLSFFRCFVY